MELGGRSVEVGEHDRVTAEDHIHRRVVDRHEPEALREPHRSWRQRARSNLLIDWAVPVLHSFEPVKGQEGEMSASPHSKRALGAGGLQAHLRDGLRQPCLPPARPRRLRVLEVVPSRQRCEGRLPRTADPQPAAAACALTFSASRTGPRRRRRTTSGEAALEDLRFLGAPWDTTSSISSNCEDIDVAALELGVAGRARSGPTAGRLDRRPPDWLKLDPRVEVTARPALGATGTASGGLSSPARGRRGRRGPRRRHALAARRRWRPRPPLEWRRRVPR